MLPPRLNNGWHAALMPQFSAAMPLPCLTSAPRCRHQVSEKGRHDTTCLTKVWGGKRSPMDTKNCVSVLFIHATCMLRCGGVAYTSPRTEGSSNTPRTRGSSLHVACAQQRRMPRDKEQAHVKRNYKPQPGKLKSGLSPGVQCQRLQSGGSTVRYQDNRQGRV
eukprot:356174-Chlamydomonas_euryale.AAC.8